jgi:acetyl-CoA/propionyl-CoA carboxylase carboxyl transferase subunit
MSTERIDVAGASDEPPRRMARVVDRCTLVLDAPLRGSGVRTGRGLVEGHPVHLFATDPLEVGGALGEAGCAQIVATVRSAVDHRAPVVGIWHSGGARLQDGTTSLHAVGSVFHALVAASGRVPVVSVVLGAAAGGAAYGPALTDFVVTGPRGRVFVTGPDIVREVTGEVVDAEALGGPELHARRSGVVHLAEQSDDDAVGRARQLVRLLAGPAPGPPPNHEPVLDATLPSSTRSAYDMRTLVSRLLDPDDQVELQPRWATNVVTTLGRLGGQTVGVLANNPWHLAGCLDCAASEKAAAFVTSCDAHGVPMVVLVDVPGYLPGTEQESGGIVVRGARLLTAFSRARVPRVTVIVRKAYGGAFIAMNSRSLGATAVYAWPGAEVGVMYPSTAVGILHRRLLASTAASRRERRQAALARSYEEVAGGLDRALREGHVDAVIEPAATRQVVRAALEKARRPDPEVALSPRAPAGVTLRSL